MSGEEYANIWMRPERPARGPRPAYSRAQITETAIRVADAEGLDAASMRRIAAEMGAGAMSLYRYVPSRDDLIELMVDHVHGEQDLPDRPTGDWRADLSRVAEESRAMWLRHPWLISLHRGRPAFGPRQLKIIEFAAGALDVGPSVDEILILLDILNGYIERTVRAELMWAEEARRTGMGEFDWMARSGPYIRRILDSGDYPMFTRIVVDARQPHLRPDERFRDGLEKVLDAVGASIQDAASMVEGAMAMDDEPDGGVDDYRAVGRELPFVRFEPR
ncbi:TetR/AcrR family transcriptional regulator [Spirillospora sp. NPDC047279]|uniref:TetR/AcrR family transcriptional regulator n=1 Tax=Spirillospora sp. NPDC047279 TaxID=3155478 RepID=UPI0033C7C178